MATPVSLVKTRWSAPPNAPLERATLGGGCFWGIESMLRVLPGVVATAVGYSGGTVPNPTYQQVCSKTTGHAEVVTIEFDPRTLSYEKLLDAFFSLHDPTTLNRQGPDVGTQYRSVIFTHTDEQRGVALAKIRELDESKRYPRPVVTQVVPAEPFYMAEAYHQQYFKDGTRACAVGG